MASYRKRGDKWQVRVQIKGQKPIYKSFRTKKAGENWAREIENDIEKSVYIDRRKSEKITIKEACKYYNKHITPQLKQKGKVGEVDFLSSVFGHYSFVTITPEVIVDHAIERLESVTGETIRKNLNTLKKVFDVGVLEYKLDLVINPVVIAKEHLKLRKIKLTSKERDRRISDPEYIALINFEHKKYTVINLIVEFAIETCMRRGEIAVMMRSHRSSQSTLMIPVTKTGVAREIPLTPRAQEILDNLPAQISGSYFGIKPDSISNAFNRMTEKLEIKDLVFHDTRHEGTSRLFEAGWHIPEVSVVTGHADWKSLKRYTNLKASNLAEKMA